MFASRAGSAVLAAGAALAGVAPAAAQDPNRMLLLAAEAARTQAGPAPATGAPVWTWLALPAVAAVAALLGAHVARRRAARPAVRTGDGWREVTYRFRGRAPLKFQNETVEMLGDVVAELERRSPQRGRRPAAPAVSPAPESARPEHTVAEGSLAAATRGGAKGDRTAAYRRARRLLAEGHDAWAVRELTGLKLAELDLLTSAAGAGAES